jgi:quercetin dioxygenase-like cupin family protein
MTRLLIIPVAALLLAAVPATAQEKKSIGTGTETKSLLENEQMRVMEIRFKPGAKTDTLSHPNRFVYALTDGALVFSPSGKRPYELSFKAGEALWLPAEATATENDGDKDVRAVVVELKGGTGVSSRVMARGKAKARAAKKSRKMASRKR